MLWRVGHLYLCLVVSLKYWVYSNKKEKTLIHFWNYSLRNTVGTKRIRKWSGVAFANKKWLRNFVQNCYLMQNFWVRIWKQRIEFNLTPQRCCGVNFSYCPERRGSLFVVSLNTFSNLTVLRRRHYVKNLMLRTLKQELLVAGSSQLVAPDTHHRSKFHAAKHRLRTQNITSNFSEARPILPKDGSQRIRNMSEFLTF